MGKVPCEFQADRPGFNFSGEELRQGSFQPCPAQDGPYCHPLSSSTGVSKCAKSHLELPAIDDAPFWAGQGWKDPCLNSSPEKLNLSQSA